MIDCENYDSGLCRYATALAEIPIHPSATNCKNCQQHKSFENPIVYSLCVVTLHKAGLFDAVKHLPLIEKTHRPAESGPGTELKKSISWFYSPKKKCRCLTRIQKMNLWGPDKCEERIETILRWLQHSARIAKIPYFRFAVLIVVTRAIKRSRSQLLQPPGRTAPSLTVLRPLKPVDGSQ